MRKNYCDSCQIETKVWRTIDMYFTGKTTWADEKISKEYCDACYKTKRQQLKEIFD
jgi:uncharacterized protein (DUF2132 family)